MDGAVRGKADRSWRVVGLSAVRRPESEWARYESSPRYDGNEAFEVIARSLRDPAEIVGPQLSVR